MHLPLTEHSPHLTPPADMQPTVYTSTNTSTQYQSTQQFLISSHYPPITNPLSSNTTTISSHKLQKLHAHPLHRAWTLHTTLSPHSARGRLKKHCTQAVKSELYNRMFKHERADFHLLPGILSPQTSHPIIGMSRSAIKHRLSPLSFLICIRRKLRLPIYPPNTRCTCGHHDHDIFGNHAFCCDKGSKKRTYNTIATDFATILSPVLAQAGYIYPNTKLDIETHLHL